jgi:segregation and condensation protein B
MQSHSAAARDTHIAMSEEAEQGFGEAAPETEPAAQFRVAAEALPDAATAEALAVPDTESASDSEPQTDQAAEAVEQDQETEFAGEAETDAEPDGEMPAPGMADEGDDERPSAVVTLHPRADRNLHLRIVEAALFAAAEPVDVAHLRSFLPDGAEVEKLLADLQANYANRGVNLVEVAGKWLFRTAEDLGYILRREQLEQRKLSKAAMETLSIIAYHQPVTRAEIEDIRGVAISKGTLDMLLEIGWVKMRGRRKMPGRPVTYGTTENFLSHFGLNEVSDLPGLQELKGAGLLEANLPPGFDIPMPRAGDELTPDEEPLDGTEAEAQQPLEMHMPEPAAEPEEGSSSTEG